MKSIKLSEQEIELLRDQYQLVLEDAEKYVQDVKNILKKLGSSTAKTVFEPVEKTPKKRGRKPRVVKEIEETPKKKRGRKPRSDKGTKRKSFKRVVKSKKPVQKPEVSQPVKSVVPKKKMKKRRSVKPKGVILTPLSKPLKKKSETKTPISPEPAK